MSAKWAGAMQGCGSWNTLIGSRKTAPAGRQGLASARIMTADKMPAESENSF